MYLTGLLKEFEEIFREMKADRNMVDFDDVMHYAILIPGTIWRRTNTGRDSDTYS